MCGEKLLCWNRRSESLDPGACLHLEGAFKGKVDTDHSSGHREGILNSGLATKCFVWIDHLGENRYDLGGSLWPWVGKQRRPL